MVNSGHKKALSNVFLFQGAYFIITGIWPLLGMDSFIAATGPKQDTWLVEMIGLLSASVGLTFIVTSLRRQKPPLVLGYSVALSFLLMDLIYVIKGVIGRVYLLDASIQFAFIALVTFLVIKRKQ
ncbi:hypothetical protein GCM10011386_28300 [Parapedobacter defluvii]|uniref:Uncharacterized protein n=1 Tax=Parapedobacter defluvii TaxID=2045106 RepID=A0ABQ1M779_9SPHI|nr:hypothetical protein [Parapedobacter defluvii]RQP19554.1 MAG: hypothetical protein EAS52_01900 [Parapedobacter sp.]GGC34522.1 hypothetical protein GCM10011386_28300 [Parapedobacter defluvii]